MKHLTLLIMALSCSVVLTACGDSETGSVTPPPPPGETGGKLIIDNGRGTVNNQDTEKGR